jgi:hypothetical protein
MFVICTTFSINKPRRGEMLVKCNKSISRNKFVSNGKWRIDPSAAHIYIHGGSAFSNPAKAESQIAGHPALYFDRGGRLAIQESRGSLRVTIGNMLFAVCCLLFADDLTTYDEIFQFVTIRAICGLLQKKSRHDRSQRDTSFKYSDVPYFISIIFLICVFPAEVSLAK